MLHQTRGIALHTVKFSETSIIAKIYTESFGLQSYLVRGIRKQHAKIKPGLFQPVTILEMTVYHKEKRGLQSIKEVHNLHPYQSIPADIRKSSVALFINELIYKSIREEEPNRELFDFLYKSCTDLDASTGNLSLFPLLFTIRLSRYLGIIPHVDETEDKSIFNLQEGMFQGQKPDHRYFLEPPVSLFMKELIREVSFSDSELSVIGHHSIPSMKFRNEMLEQMLLYYRLHLPGFRDILSHRVLHTVLA